jgi:RecG-like helicase
MGGILIVMNKAFMHHKFTIIDNKTLVTGTANYTYNGFHKNAENIFIIDDAEIVAEFVNQFKELSDFHEFETGLIISNHKQKLEHEIKWALRQISFFENELAQIEKIIELYDVKYRIRFRSLILEILERRNKILEIKAQLTEKWEDKDKWHDNNQTFVRILGTEASDNKIEKEEHNFENQKTIKELFRAAVKLCHPDNSFIADNDKEKANQIFIRLKEAYNANDLTTIQSILNDLESGLAFGKIDCSSINDIELDKILTTLKNRLQELTDEINLKKSDKRYYLSIDNETLMKHFEGEEASLNEALRVLRL